MMFFRRDELTVRCTLRGLTLSAPDRDRLLNACEPSRRRRLQRCLGPVSASEPPWLVQWQKSPGDPLQPDDVVATLHRDGVVVELAYAQKGVLGEWLVLRGEQVPSGARLATLERRARPAAAAPAPDPPTKALLRQFVARQRQDAALIATLQAELAALKGRLTSDVAVNDMKFKRLKLEFSKRYHPDARPGSDAERAHRQLVFQEFWPVVEAIERS
jgi:hypothetical protein